jgi:hypothetical protein
VKNSFCFFFYEIQFCLGVGEGGGSLEKPKIGFFCCYISVAIMKIVENYKNLIVVASC